MTLDYPFNAIVIAVDRFSAGYLGPYGNTWIDTPAFNRLAGQATLFETVVSDSPALKDVYHSYWHGGHAMIGPSTRAASLPQLIGAAGVTTGLLTDSTSLGEDPLGNDFGQRIVLEFAQPDRPVDDIEETQLGQLFAQTIQWIHTVREPFLLWVHAQGMDRVWDAPMVLREQFADSEDPSPSSTVVAPNFSLTPDYDPDQLLGFLHAYAGQVAVLDLCLAALMDAIDKRTAGRPTLVLFTSPRGFPLGEHGRIGACGDQLTSEVLQVPCLVRHPDRETSNRRCHTMIQPPDVYATLLDWFGQLDGVEQPFRRSMLPLLTGEAPWTRQLVCAASGQQLAVRTPIWFLVSELEKAPQLFVKPDDRWEVNEVADRCQPVTSQLCAVLDQLSKMGFSEDLELPLELVQES